jgi:G-protein signaling modulator 2
LQLTPDGKKLSNSQMDRTGVPKSASQNENLMSAAKNDDDFFDMLTRSQSKRMDDQRCTLKVRRKIRLCVFVG